MKTPADSQKRGRNQGIYRCVGQQDAVAWPASFEPGNAALFSHNEIVIAAPCERVWSILVAAHAWPDWYENAHDVHIAGEHAGALQKQSTFTWTTFGIAVESQVRQYLPPVRLAWSGRATGMTAYHAWVLSPLAEGCHVVTEETNNGPAAETLRRTNPEAIHDGHAAWLAQLKAAAMR